MMNDGGPAFPVPADGQGGAGSSGASLRDLFAACALQGILASQGPLPTYASRCNYVSVQDVSAAYTYADLMLEERTRQ